MSDYISKSETIESIKAEIQCVEKEKQQYFEQGNFHNGNILVEKIQAMKLVMKIVANEPTVDEKEIICKPFERVVERLEEQEDHYQEMNNIFGMSAIEEAKIIVKEEGGIYEED